MKTLPFSIPDLALKSTRWLLAQCLLRPGRLGLGPWTYVSAPIIVGFPAALPPHNGWIHVMTVKLAITTDYQW